MILPQTCLSDLRLPHLSTLLEEAFGILPPCPGIDTDPAPMTVQELATRSQQSISVVCARLQWIQREVEDLFLPFATAQELQEKGEAFFFDARTYGERIATPLHWAYSFTAPRLLKLLGASSPRLTVLTLATEEAKGMSAALFLRGQGIAAKTLYTGISPAECEILGKIPSTTSRLHLLLPPALRFSPASPL